MKKISVFCDGGARGNPGPAAIAFVVSEDGKIIYKFSKKIGKTTNNVAEYQAVIEALKWLKQQTTNNKQHTTINFFLDSQLVVNQLNGFFKIKDAKLRNLIIKARILEQEIGRKIFYNLISRRQNKIADSLINQTLNSVSR